METHLSRVKWYSHLHSEGSGITFRMVITYMYFNKSQSEVIL